MSSAKAQLAMVVDDPLETEREFESEAGEDHIHFLRVIAACRDAALAFGGYDKAANALDRIWSKHGRGVSASFLRSTLNPEPETKSYFRYEWVRWFSRQSADVRELVIGGAMGDSAKDPKDELEDLKAIVRENYPKAAEAHIRKAKTIRVRR